MFYKSCLLLIFLVLSTYLNLLQASPPSTYTQVYKPYTATKADGSTYTISTFHPSGAINGNVRLEGGTLDLQGQTLRINGHLIHSGGTLDVNDGKLIVTGDYRIQTPSGLEYSSSSGLLRMDNTGDEIEIQGSFVTDSNQDHRSYLTSGSLEVKGDFTQLSSYSSSVKYNFSSSGDHKVVLSGEGKQVVFFTDVSGVTYSNLTNLEVRNTSGLLELPEMVAVSTSYTGQVLKLPTFKVSRMSFTLKEDMSLEMPEGGAMLLSGSVLNLNGHTLTLKGDLIQTGGTLDVNEGKLIVTGDYRIQTPSGSGYAHSTGLLRMDNAKDTIQIQGDFVTDSNQDQRKDLTAGILEVKGDFTQLSSYSSSVKYNFNTSGTHKVLLSGKGSQVVKLTDVSGVNYSFFTNLEINNTSGLLELGEIAARNLTYSTGLDEPVLKGFYVHRMGFTLQEDMTIEVPTGSIAKLSGSDLNLNGHRLTVKGDLLHSGGTLDINKGELLVKGDYRIQTPSGSGYAHSTGFLRMDNSEDKVKVDGNFVTDSNQDHRNYLTSGTLEVKGDFTQLSSYSSSVKYNFSTSGDHKVVLSGEGKQVVFFTDVSGTSYSNLTNLDVRNTSGLLELPEMIAVNTSYTGQILKLPTFKVSRMSFILEEDMTLEMPEGVGMLLSGSTLNLNGYTLTLKGNLIQTGGILDVNEGKLIVTGDYRIQTPSGSGYASSAGLLRMDNAKDTIQIQGDFITDSNQDHREVLTAGVLEVKGDFTQLSSYSSSVKYNFNTGGTHKVLLSGKGSQVVKLTDVSGVNYSFFTNLEVSNTSGLLDLGEVAARNLTYTVDVGEPVLKGFSVNRMGFTLQEDMTVEVPAGSVARLSGSSLNLNGHRLKIKGDLLHSGGTLEVNNGELLVEGDYRIQTPTSGSGYSSSSGLLRMDSTEGEIVVQGSFVTDSNKDHRNYLTSGTLEVKGDFTQLSSYSSSVKYNFSTSGDHKVVLSGEDKQVVFFTDVSGTSYSNLTNLEIRNTSGLLKLPEMIAVNTSYTGQTLKLPTFKVSRMSFTLKEDMSIEMPEGGGMFLSGSVLNLNGHTLVLKGDLIQTGGTLDVNEGKLIVTGDYRIQTPSGSGYASSAGLLRMDNAKDTIQIQGDFITDSNQDHREVLTAGVLEVKGSFTQLSSYSSSVKYNFHTSGTHKVVLSGKGKQVLAFTDVSGASYSLFTYLESQNTVGLNFSSRLTVSKLFDHCGYAFTLSDEAGSSFPDFDKDGQKDHVDSYPKDASNQSNNCGKLDTDGDGVTDDLDVFPDDPNESIDTDNDGTGNNADTDDDNDGVSDDAELRDETDPLDKDDYHLNQPPTANAGDDITLPAVNISVKVTGTATDSDGTIASYEWKEDGVVLAKTALFEYTPTTVGVHTLTFTVKDDDEATVIDTKVVIVSDDTSINLTNGLVAYYEFEGDARDSSGYDNHGTAKNGVKFAAGVLGQGAVFSDTKEIRVEVADSDSLNTPDAFSLSLWVRPSEYLSKERGSVLIQKDYSVEDWAGGEYNLGLTKEGTIYFSVVNYDAVTVRDSIETNLIPVNQWSHVTASFNRGEMRLFIDGQLVESKQSLVEQVTTKEYSYDGLRMGNMVYNTYHDRWLIGNLDEVRVYNRAINTSEVKALYSEGTGGLDQKVITGTVKNDEGENVAGINVKLEYLVSGEEQSVSTTTDASGSYNLKVDKSYFSDTADTTYLIYAFRAGYHPVTETLQIGSADSYQVDFVINPVQVNEVILEIEPNVHHLGDDSYSGSVNSQFQKKTEGTRFSKSFEISAMQYSSYEKAVLTFKAKGIQSGASLLINERVYELIDSPSDGSYQVHTIALEKSSYLLGSNDLAVTSDKASFSDYDDFEFSNIVLTFSGRVTPDTDGDGTDDDMDTDDDNDGMPDIWEVLFGLNPLDSTDASLDTDGDGLSNLDEYQHGKDPLMPDQNEFKVFMPVVIDMLLDD